MVSRNIGGEIRFHVYTEADRTVPPHMIKHQLEPWSGVSGARRSWWYKMQLFNPEHHDGDLLYFDLDVVIVSDITWITELPTNQFWTIRDFRRLQRARNMGMNSSMMWWNVGDFADIWEKFSRAGIQDVMRRHLGDQDYLYSVIDRSRLRFVPDDCVVSWRWQALDGGYDFSRRCHRNPGSGTKIAPNTSVLVLHGKPKPHDIHDPVIKNHWR
jgi:hypothetical protein